MDEGAEVVLTTAQVLLRDELLELGKALLKEGFYFRLMITEDISNLNDIRRRAKEGMSPNPDSRTKDNFFYGCALPPALQERVHRIVLDHKVALLDAVAQGYDMLDELGVTAAFDEVQKAYLIQLKSCGMGFYISQRISAPRPRRLKSMTKEQTSEKPLGVQPASVVMRSPGEPTGKRRKFQVIRHIRN